MSAASSSAPIAARRSALGEPARRFDLRIHGILGESLESQRTGRALVNRLGSIRPEAAEYRRDVCEKQQDVSFEELCEQCGRAFIASARSRSAVIADASRS